jgi:hypothetical protein
MTIDVQMNNKKIKIEILKDFIEQSESSSS